MAKERIVLVKDTKTGEESLVSAKTVKRAVDFVSGARFVGETASAEDVIRLVNAGCKVLKIEHDTPAEETSTASEQQGVGQEGVVETV